MRCFPSYRFLLPLLLVVASACVKVVYVNGPPDPVDEPESGPVEDVGGISLSLSVASSRPVATKMTDAITQSEGTRESFRGIETMYLIPFRQQRTVAMGDVRHGPNLVLPQQGLPNSFGTSAQEGNFAGLVNNNNAHLYKTVFFKARTSALLAYGKAPDQRSGNGELSLAEKRLNGVLTSSDLENTDNTADILFSLERMLTPAAKTEMNGKVDGVLTYLNSLTGATVSVTTYPRNSYTSNGTTTYRWDTPSTYSNYADLAKLFTEFLTNDGGNAFSGSSDAISQMLTTLYNRLYPLTSNTSQYLSYYTQRSTSQSRYYYVQELAKAVRTLINNSAYITITNANSANATVTLKPAYQGVPDSYGIPAGAVSIKWDGTQFKRVTEADLSTVMAPAESYCFPPSLWYYANSTLRCSDRTDIAEEYIEGNATWNDIFSQYDFSNSVVGGATSAAMKDPMHYGVALLQFVFNPASSEGGTSNLLDGDANTVAVNNSNFPLTGVIVGEQRTQLFNFTPRSEEACYVYDTEVNDGNTPRAYISSNAALLKPVLTLVVETEPGEDVHYALEFRNNSANEFKGADGLIKPGSCFYLIGELEFDKASQNPNSLPGIFVKDHITSVTLTVKGLSKAYNVVPELRDPQLQIGVESKMEWIQVSPSEVPMY